MESLKSFIDYQLNKLVDLVSDNLNKVTDYLAERGGLVSTSQIWGAAIGGFIAKTLVTLIIWMTILIGAVLLLVGNLAIFLFQVAQPKVQDLYAGLGDKFNSKFTLDLESLNKKGELFSLKEMLNKITEDNSHPPV